MAVLFPVLGLLSNTPFYFSQMLHTSFYSLDNHFSNHLNAPFRATVLSPVSLRAPPFNIKHLKRVVRCSCGCSHHKTVAHHRLRVHYSLLSTSQWRLSLLSLIYALLTGGAFQSGTLSSKSTPHSETCGTLLTPTLLLLLTCSPTSLPSLSRLTK